MTRCLGKPLIFLLLGFDVASAAVTDRAVASDAEAHSDLHAEFVAAFSQFATAAGDRNGNIRGAGGGVPGSPGPDHQYIQSRDCQKKKHGVSTSSSHPYTGFALKSGTGCSSFVYCHDGAETYAILCPPGTLFDEGVSQDGTCAPAARVTCEDDNRPAPAEDSSRPRGVRELRAFYVSSNDSVEELADTAAADDVHRQIDIFERMLQRTPAAALGKNVSEKKKQINVSKVTSNFESNMKKIDNLPVPPTGADVAYNVNGDYPTFSEKDAIDAFKSMIINGQTRPNRTNVLMDIIDTQRDIKDVTDRGNATTSEDAADNADCKTKIFDVLVEANEIFLEHVDATKNMRKNIAERMVKRARNRFTKQLERSYPKDYRSTDTAYAGLAKLFFIIKKDIRLPFIADAWFFEKDTVWNNNGLLVPLGANIAFTFGYNKTEALESYLKRDSKLNTVVETFQQNVAAIGDCLGATSNA